MFERLLILALVVVLKVCRCVPQDDLKGWVSNITKSINEHDEIAKWGQPHPTTSSTDEGTRRDARKSEAEKSERGEKSDRDRDRVSERSDKGEKPEKRTGKKK